MERVTWKLTLPYVKFTVCLRKLKWALYQPRGVGWGGRWVGRFKREGIYVYLWLMHVEI